MKRSTLEISIGIVVIIALVAGALILGGTTAEWGGADGGAGDIIDKTGYEPWFTPIWEPPSGEIESMFFCLQAALGSAVVFFLLGYWYGQSRKRKEEN